MRSSACSIRGRRWAPAALLLGLTLASPAAAFEVRSYAIPEGGRPQDVAPAPDGSIWYTPQAQGELARVVVRFPK